MEPPKKQMKTSETELKELLYNMHSKFINKLKNIEEKLDKISSRYHLLEEKVENALLKIKESALKVQHSNASTFSNSSNSTLVGANEEADYPNGSWLGDPNNENFRVRCNISPVDLETINNTCTTPEKMSLTLLDHLFDREVQAESNISGAGKHGKKQLDPLKIYGIKCHVSYMFNINNKDWHRIKQNIDSKCRTAFRRKKKGMPLIVKSFRERSAKKIREQTLKTTESSLPSNVMEDYCIQNIIIPKAEPVSFQDIQESEFSQIIPLKLEADGCSFAFTNGHTQIIHTEHGDIQVIQATEEQLEQLKQNHQIEILSEATMFDKT